MRLKKKKTKQIKNKLIALRVTDKDYKLIKRKALLYCEGNISEFITYASRNFLPSKDELQ